MLDTLVGRVWDDSPPIEVRNVLYTYVTRLRRILEVAERRSGEKIELRRQSGGYLLDVDPELVDLHRFENLMARSRLVTDDEERAQLQKRALSLWRGTPLADLRGEWFSRVREWIERRRLEALSEWARTELRLGRPLTVIEEFGKVLTEQPFAESIHRAATARAVLRGTADGGARTLRGRPPADRRRHRRRARAVAPTYP